MLGGKYRVLKITGLLAGGLGFAMPAFAQQTVSWDYFSASLVVGGEIDDVTGTVSDVDQGYRLEAVASLGEYAFFRTRMDTYDADTGSPPEAVDFQEWGFGGHYPIDAGPVTLSPWGALSFDRMSVEGDIWDGVSVNLGVRALFLNGTLETAFGLKNSGVSADGVDDFTINAYELSAAYQVLSDLDAVLNFTNTTLENDDTGDEADLEGVMSVGARFRF